MLTNSRSSLDLRAVGFAEEEAVGARQALFPDVGLEPAQVLGIEADVDAVELAGRAVLLAIEQLHPAVKIRMLSPVMKLGRVLRFKIDTARDVFESRIRKHIKSHEFLLFVFGLTPCQPRPAARRGAGRTQRIVGGTG